MKALGLKCCDHTFTARDIKVPMMNQMKALGTNDHRLYGGNAKSFSFADCPECRKRYVLWLKPEHNTYRVLTISLREDVEQPQEETEKVANMDTSRFNGMDKTQLRAFLDSKEIEYVPQWGEPRLRELAIQVAE